MALNLYRAILVLLHVICHVYSEARRALRTARQLLEDFFISPRGLKAELEYVREGSSVLSKPLSHLAIILGPEAVSVRDVVRLALWSHAAGATYVSFYDHSGQLKKNKSALDKALVSACKVKSHIPKTNGYLNGYAGKQFPHIMLLDISDGKPGIVRAAKQICEEVLSKEISPSEIDLELFSKYVMKESGVPEPELAFYCGDTFSLYGFLPWHSRITEFLPLHSHHNVSVRTFVNLIRRYNKCEQRLGT
ncbi:Dehydrodolichyl diphosphate synthase complex subunit NUS1 [Frankliniella fusca]|uniref:ditrans,polycis-polyprenyl diphosphate synthase [(2E,6E)-farnesyldiphosphate specific] n=1 Tax=Frankliniella fusca TaxID=407009 RepID=A0AAE1H0C0_9NEOP|nr:Dehydrodolichyl diphosphate synthase complex subunit NUS1 [Frankliniella fusca]